MQKRIFITICFFLISTIFQVVFIALFGGWTKLSLFSKIIHKIISFPNKVFNITYTNSEWYAHILISPLFYSILLFLILLFKPILFGILKKNRQ